MARAPGIIRDSIVSYLSDLNGDASIAEINEAVNRKLGSVSTSSVRSYLGLNVPQLFERTTRGRYRLKVRGGPSVFQVNLSPTVHHGKATLYHADCFDWLAKATPNSIHAVVTDPPYGIVEYSEKELTKLRAGSGGVWRIPPSFDGHRRSPLPRFTVLGDQDRRELHAFFRRLGTLIGRVVVPGANIVIASNPLLSHIVADSMADRKSVV